ncbi:biotin--[acetyl-CoA-carboxylase] ligase [Salinibacterium sp. G-O1]|uniref:biotin--[acetyl-CoA-carboxylase] ligase n=1 Tax=Salinibacterium sp. G-O1 TaxID=3046208 RepID=UPI0024B98E57|nr:biotin--[acetyl-CoA-carboxylase] ligase [Salinibacterium sp. G-O1]MDJ0336500.1 biotin--[acetyl-CoA-carboxylase] ligase [Salinibacterium sp. G-O1]
MHLPLSNARAARLDVLPRTGSTNAELVALASGGALAHFSVLVTTDQTAGRGRLGRTWLAPAGKTLAVSVFLATGAVSPDRLGWLPLITGLAMTRAVDSLIDDHDVSLKWPNDVHVDGLKISGILAELIPGVGVVIGAGLNLTTTASELPTPTSTSLALNGWGDGSATADDAMVDAALSAYLVELDSLYSGLAAAAFDADDSGLRSQVAAACSTIGRSVRVDLPDGDQLFGTATAIDESGRLVVSGTSFDGVRAIAAGDVTHLRYA